VDPNLAGIAVSVLGEEADKATWTAMKDRLVESVDETVRARILIGLSRAKDAELAAAARELVLDPVLRDSEILTPLFVQMGSAETRDTAWAWLKEHLDAVLARLARRQGVALIGMAGRAFCDDGLARDVEAFFGPKVAHMEGGPRVLATAVEEAHLCAARRTRQEESAREFFAPPRSTR
jgi:alanyl aminopeptidase